MNKMVCKDRITNLSFPLNLVRTNILNLSPYSTARDESDIKYGIYLDANENPFQTGYNRYPDPHHLELKKAIAAKRGVENTEMIFAGNGSDEAIDLVIRIFCNPGKDNVISVSPTYGMYKVACATNNIEYREVPLDYRFSVVKKTILERADENSKVLFLCSPNNPTGNLLDKKTVLELINEFKGVVVIDEAYIDFSGDEGFIPFIPKYKNLIVLQTMSKAMGMAALRVGFAFGNKEIIDLFNKVKYPYNLNKVSQDLAIFRLKNDNKAEVEKLITLRESFTGALMTAPNVEKVYKSDSNFILVKFSNPEYTYKLLEKNGIVVRDRSKLPGCEGCLRVTVGKQAENDKVIDVLNRGEDRLPDKETCRDNIIEISRSTKETTISAKLDFTGESAASVNTGIGFFDHMLEQLVTHGGISVDVDARGDLSVDSHHTVEDVAIVLGEALNRYFTGLKGYGRYGFSLPMDESCAEVLLDLGGRAFLKWNALFKCEKIGELPTEMIKHFFSSMSTAGKFTLHISADGENDHHKCEAIFKAFARALKMALSRAEGSSLPSSKGVI